MKYLKHSLVNNSTGSTQDTDSQNEFENHALNITAPSSRGKDFLVVYFIHVLEHLIWQKIDER